MNPKKFREALDAAIGLAIVAYIIYGKTTGDDDLTKLKAHGRYYWWKVKLWYKHQTEPAWKKELRMYFTTVPTTPKADWPTEIPDWIAGTDGLHAG